MEVENHGRLGIAVSRLRKEENENGKPEKLKADTEPSGNTLGTRTLFLIIV